MSASDESMAQFRKDMKTAKLMFEWLTERNPDNTPSAQDGAMLMRLIRVVQNYRIPIQHIEYQVKYDADMTRMIAESQPPPE